MEEMQKNESRVMKENSELTTRNGILESDLAKWQKECQDLKRAMENHTRDVKSLKVTLSPPPPLLSFNQLGVK